MEYDLGEHSDLKTIVRLFRVFDIISLITLFSGRNIIHET